MSAGPFHVCHGGLGCAGDCSCPCHFDEPQDALDVDEVVELDLIEERQRYEAAEFTEGPAGELARERWARNYDDLNGAPEGEWDR